MNPDQEITFLKDINAWALERARVLGADGAFVSSQSGMSSKVSYEKQDFSLVSSHRGGGVSITVHQGDKCGGVGINTFEKVEVEEAIKRALELAKPTIPDPYIALAPPAQYVDLKSPWDESLVNLQPNDLLDYLSHLMALAKEDERVSLDHVTVDRSVGVRCIANSEGMLAFDRHAQMNWSLMGMAIQGEEVTGLDYLGNRTRLLGEAKQLMGESARELSGRLVGQLGAKALEEGYRGQVLLPPTLVEELLIEPLVYHLQGSQIMDGKSRMADSLGDRVAHEKFTLKDDVHNIDLRGATAFSGEGVPTKPMVLVEKGILKTHVDSLYSSRRRGTKPTGNGGGPHVACLGAGEYDRSQLIDMADGPVLSPSRFSGNLDSVTGDFSGVAKGARLENSGETGRPIKEVMISGNVFEMLLGPMSGGRELKTDGGYYRLPDILVDGVSVVGA